MSWNRSCVDLTHSVLIQPFGLPDRYDEYFRLRVGGLEIQVGDRALGLPCCAHVLYSYTAQSHDPLHLNYSRIASLIIRTGAVTILPANCNPGPRLTTLRISTLHNRCMRHPPIRRSQLNLIFSS